jgi:NitT/TauT family transport system ATP-binding protein
VLLRGVHRVFEGGVAAIDGVDLDVEPGAFVALLGPSGCGKSTLLRVIAGLDRPDAGEVSLEASERAPASAPGGRSPIAFVFQDPHLLPWRSVLDNAALPLELAGVPRAARLAAAREALEQVELSDAAERFPAELSGGMRMRASLARALITRPELLLLDEPFAALDELTRHRLDDQLRRLWTELPMTVLFVTHSIIEATYLAERAIVLSPRPARIIADHALAFPAPRTAALRTTPAFNQEARSLYEALERGGA